MGHSARLAIFGLLIGIAATPIIPAAAQPRFRHVAVCESRLDSGERRVFCPMDTRGGVHVRRQLSNRRCVQGRTFFVEARGVFVRRGCRAVFASNRR